MRHSVTPIATLLVAGLFSSVVGAQTVSAGGSGGIGGPNAAAASGAAITHTPGTPGASDTPAALQASHSSSPDALSPAELRALKKQARKTAHSSASASDTSKSSAVAPAK